MVDLGLVLLCACGIGAMHRGNMGAHSPDFPGSLACWKQRESVGKRASQITEMFSQVSFALHLLFLDLASQSVHGSFQVNQNSVCWQVDSWHREQTRIPFSTQLQPGFAKDGPPSPNHPHGNSLVRGLNDRME